MLRGIQRTNNEKAPWILARSHSRNHHWRDSIIRHQAGFLGTMIQLSILLVRLVAAATLFHPPNSENFNIRHQAQILGTTIQQSILQFRLPIITPPINPNRLGLNSQLQPSLRLYSLHLQFLHERLAPESATQSLKSAFITFTKRHETMTSQQRHAYLVLFCTYAFMSSNL